MSYLLTHGELYSVMKFVLKWGVIWGSCKHESVII